jgi:hypothetical protein
MLGKSIVDEELNGDAQSSAARISTNPIMRIIKPAFTG